MRWLVAPVGALLGDMGRLLGKANARIWFLIFAMLITQAGFWYMATPGPVILGFAIQDPIAAGSAVGWSLVFLLLIPALIYRLVVGRLETAGLRWGKAGFGLAAVLGLSIVAVPIIALSSNDPGLAATYPWPGMWAGEGPVQLALWAVAYFLYYLAFEAFYRGFVLNTAARYMSIASALWLQAILATLIHLGKPLPELLAAAPASLLFGVLAVRSRSILYPALLHLVIGLTLDITLLARAGVLNW